MRKSSAIWMAVTVGVVVCVVTCLLTIVVFFNLGGDDNSLSLKEFSEIGEGIEQYYLYDYDIEEVQIAGMKAMVDSLDDPYTVYYTKEEYEEFNKSSEGEYEGLGMMISLDKETGGAVIVKFFEGSSAQEAGVMVGDVIVSVDGLDVTEKTLEEISALCLGEGGTFVNLGVMRENEVYTYELERRAIVVDMLTYEVMDDNIGYIHVLQFGGNASVLFAKAMGEFADLGVDGVVIDLRDNPGGYLHVVVEMLDMVLPEGIIVYTEDKYGNKETEFSDEANIDMSFTLLVNGNTASASEIFAGAMQDYDYCEVVGTTTYGKGVVQAVLPMEEAGGGLKITTSEYFTPDGRSINGNGIEPDFYLELDEGGQDNQLIKAIEVLRQIIE